jgi:YhcH/YjgK/YiaL family protein
MIVGSIGNMEHSCREYPGPIRQALEYLHSHDFTKMKDGKYAIDGERSFIKLQRYQTRPVSDGRPESHQKYVDIQYVVEGQELLGWCPLSPDLPAAQAYDEENDVAFYEHLVPESDIVLSAGSFAVLYPEDVHRPCGTFGDKAQQVTKAVVKIAVSTL